MRLARRAFLAAVLALAAGWVVVDLPSSVALAVGAGCFATSLWLQAPMIALYGLAAICPFELSYQVAGLSDVRVHDVLLIALAVPAAVAVVSRSPRRLRLKMPLARVLMILWVFLLVWGSITFLLGPVNQWLLRDALHNAWYVYRDLGRSLLIFPLVLVCCEDGRSVERILGVLVLVATGVALYAIWLARESAENATGHFGTTNALAGFLILVIPFAMTRVLTHDSRRIRVLHAMALVVMLRALWLAGSRGGLVACLASLGVLATLVPRRRAVAAAMAGLAVLSMVVALRGGTQDLPMIKRFIVLTNVQEVETFQWRQEQWGLFIQRIRERPWLGTGSDVDESMREMDRARTAHNAFLSLSVKSGLPAAAAWVVVLLLVLGVAIRGIMKEADSHRRAFWIGSLGFLVALLVHNMVESTLISVVTQHIFWIVTASALILSKEDGARAVAARETARGLHPVEGRGMIGA